KQPPPVPFGALLVVDAVIGHAPAMRLADVVFDNVVDLGLAQRLREPTGLFRREAAVDAGNPDVDARPDICRIAVRAVFGVACEIAAVEARRRDDAVGMGGGGVQRPRPAHAVADSANPAGG